MAGEGTEALEQLGLLNNQFARTMAPLDNYSQNLLALAVQKRQREQQLQDQATARAAAAQNLQTENSLMMARQKQQQDFQVRLEKAADDAATARQKAGWDHAEKEKQADLLREAEAEAARMSVDVSSIKGDERSRYLAIQGKLNAAHSATITSLLQQGAKLRRELSTLTNVDPARLDQIAKQQFLSDPEISAAFGPDIPAIQRDSSEIARIIDRLSASKKKEDKEKLSMLVSKWNGAQAFAEIEAAKNAPHKERVEFIRDQLQTQRAILASQLKGTDLTAETIGTMLGGVADEVGKIKQEAQAKATNPRDAFAATLQAGGARPGWTPPAFGGGGLMPAPTGAPAAPTNPYAGLATRGGDIETLFTPPTPPGAPGAPVQGRTMFGAPGGGKTTVIQNPFPSIGRWLLRGNPTGTWTNYDANGNPMLMGTPATSSLPPSQPTNSLAAALAILAQNQATNSPTVAPPPQTPIWNTNFGMFPAGLYPAASP